MTIGECILNGMTDFIILDCSALYYFCRSKSKENANNFGPTCVFSSRFGSGKGSWAYPPAGADGQETARNRTLPPLPMRAGTFCFLGSDML